MDNILQIIIRISYLCNNMDDRFYKKGRAVKHSLKKGSDLIYFT